MLRNLFLFLLFISFSSISLAINANKSPDATFEMFGGVYEPNDPNWETYYDSKRMFEASFSYAIRILSVFDIGTSISYGQDTGVGVLPLSNLNRGSVTYQISPVDVFLVLRGRFSNKQWIVPYVGGGYTRFFYRQTIEGQGYTRGAVNGLHARAGLQILLDPMDSQAANDILANLGVINSYLVFEAKFTQAEAGIPATDIGGISYRTGIMLEY